MEFLMSKLLPKYPEKMRILRKNSTKTILDLLKKGPAGSEKIFTKIRARHYTLCDDEIVCECGKWPSKFPEWKHQIRWALQDLKYYGKISYDKESRNYVLK